MVKTLYKKAKGAIKSGSGKILSRGLDKYRFAGHRSQ